MSTQHKGRGGSRFKEQPQFYEHRVETAIEALAHAQSGAQLIVMFLQAELGPQWKNYEWLDEAGREFRKAQRWLKSAKSCRRQKRPGRSS